MPTAYCSLDEVYGSMSWTKPKDQRGQNQFQGQGREDRQDQRKQDMNPMNGSESLNDIRSFCPNCKNCLDKNNALQQQIVNQNISPRPRWVPQYPGVYDPYDPYNRYWANATQLSNKEYFGSDHEYGRSKIENLLNLILFVLIALFLIQLVELISTLTNKKSTI